MNKFELTSANQPTGDQPEAIAQLTEGVHEECETASSELKEKQL
jgi:excinuclease UvrABC helicase subunit UvrB